MGTSWRFSARFSAVTTTSASSDTPRLPAVLVCWAMAVPLIALPASVIAIPNVTIAVLMFGSPSGRRVGGLCDNFDENRLGGLEGLAQRSVELAGLDHSDCGDALSAR